MKTMVLGIGAIGQVTATLLAGSREVDKLVLASRRTERAKKLARKLGKKNILVKKVNADNVNEMVRAFKGLDLVINLALPRFNLKIMKACLKAKVNYMDTATDLALAKEKPGDSVKAPPECIQLEMDSQFKKAGLTAMLGQGCDPGLTNVFARYAADGMDRVDEILVRDGDNSQIEGYEFATMWSADTLIEEVLMPALAFRDGRFVRLGSVEGEEVFPFPEPVGPLTVYNVDHEETNTLPLYIGKGVRNADFKLALPKEFAEAMRIFRKWGLGSAEPIEVRSKFYNTTAKVAPRDVLTALLPTPADMNRGVTGATCIGTLVRGEKEGRKVERFVYTWMDHADCIRKTGFNAVSYLTGAPPVVAAEMFARGEIDLRGVFPPEVLDPKPYMDHLPGVGIKVYEKSL